MSKQVGDKDIFHRQPSFLGGGRGGGMGGKYPNLLAPDRG